MIRKVYYFEGEKVGERLEIEPSDRRRHKEPDLTVKWGDWIPLVMGMFDDRFGKVYTVTASRVDVTRGKFRLCILALMDGTFDLSLFQEGTQMKRKLSAPFNTLTQEMATCLQKMI